MIDIFNISFLSAAFMFFTSGISLIFAIGQLCGRVRYVENYILSGLLFCLSIVVFQMGIIVNGMYLAHPALLYFHATVLYAMAPLAFCTYYLVILPVETMSRRFTFLFLPVLVGFAADIGFMFLPETEQVGLMMDLFGGANLLPARIARIVIMGAGLEMGVYLAMSMKTLIVARRNDANRPIVFLLMVNICVTSVLSLLVLLGYLLGSGTMFRWGTNVAGILIIGAYFAGQRYPKMLQLLMFEAEKKYYGRSLLEGIDVASLNKRLHALMKDERLYADDQLNLRDLADELSITPHQLSQFLNERLNTNFNTYINQYRIREAGEMLINQPDKTVLAISLEVGFNSKSAFYEAFSRFTGMSPQSYRKSGGVKKSGGGN